MAMGTMYEKTNSLRLAVFVFVYANVSPLSVIPGAQ